MKKTGKFYNTIMFTCVKVVFMVTVLLVVLLIALTMPVIKDETGMLVQEYMTDVTEVVGKTIDYEIANIGTSVLSDYKEMSSILGDISVSHYESGYAYLLDSTGKILWYPVEQYVGATISNDGVSNILNQVTQGNTHGFAEYELDNVEKYTAYSAGNHGDYILFLSVDKADTEAIVTHVGGRIISLGILLVIILIGAVILAINLIFKSVNRV